MDLDSTYYSSRCKVICKDMNGLPMFKEFNAVCGWGERIDILF
jgi:hypothetical protein